jgi:ribosomal protein S18 acetylase RimI-like enzyme
MVPDLTLTPRPARAADVPAMAALVARCDATHCDWAPAGWLPPAFDDEAVAALAERVADDEHVCTVAEPDGVVAGFATVRPAGDPGRGHLSNLFVDPPHWGAGIGRSLLAEAERAMRERGWSSAELSTQVGNARARRMYERAGWRDTGGRHPHDDGLEMAEYEKELA